MAVRDPMVGARLKPETMAWLDEQCAALEMTRAEFVRAMLKELSELPADDPAKGYNATQGVLLDRLLGGWPPAEAERESLSA